MNAEYLQLLSELSLKLQAYDSKIRNPKIFDEELKKQVEEFDIVKFQNAIGDFANHYENITHDIDAFTIFIDVFINIKYNYSLLSFSQDILTKDSPIWKNINFKFVSIKDFILSIEKILALDMLEMDNNAFKIICIEHINNRFMKFLIQDFYTKANEEFRKGRNRLKGLRTNQNSDVAFSNFIKVFVKDNSTNINEDKFDLFNPKSSTRNALNPSKTKFYDFEAYNELFFYDFNALKVQKKINFKVGIFNESQVDLIRILEPQYIINSYDEWVKVNQYEYITESLAFYRSKYLNKRVQDFGLFKFNKK